MSVSKLIQITIILVGVCLLHLVVVGLLPMLFIRYTDGLGLEVEAKYIMQIVAVGSWVGLYAFILAGVYMFNAERLHGRGD